jgi:hypothetical protein
MDIIYIRFRVIGKIDLKILDRFFLFNENFSCIFVWNIAELAIVPTTCRLPSVPLAKSNDLEM